MDRSVHHLSHAAMPARREPLRFGIERFEYAPADLLLRLALSMSHEPPRGREPLLVIAHDRGEHVLPPLVSCVGRTQSATLEAWIWRAAFPLLPEIACDSRGLLTVRFGDELTLSLPSVGDRGGVEHAHAALAPGHGSRRRRIRMPMGTWPYIVRRGALALVVGCQMGLAPGLAGATAPASAETAPAGGEPTQGTPAPEQNEPVESNPEAPPSGHPEEAAPEPTPKPPENAPGHPAPPAPEPVAQHSAEAPTQPAAPQGPPTGAEPTTATPASEPAPTASAGVGGTARPAHTHHRDGKSKHRSTRSGDHAARGAKHHHKGMRTHHKRSGHHEAGKAHLRQRAAAPAPAGAPSFSELPQALVELPPGLTTLSESQPPAFLIPIYKGAARTYHVPWRVLAAINQIETDYGRDLSTSPAGAMGWMQFMPSTWQEWAVDADGDGNANPYSPRDAIFTAARYLQASGAAHDLRAAIYAYNHADWYVAEVLFQSRRIDTSALALDKGYALPLDAKYMKELGRTDDGLDIETAPDGAAVYSITPGIVTAVASDPGGFGPNYPVIEATGGSLKGQYIYYGHVAQSLVQVGQHVAAGQPIAIMGHTGDAVSLGHGHIEIGFSDAAGDPLSHHGASAWTPAGEIMREFLVSLSTGFKIHNE
jgi:Transglycosylase SLT domain/Peptidase family M23